MKLSQKIYIALFGLVCALSGLIASDIATGLGVQDSPYLVEFRHEQTRQSDIACARRGQGAGDNMSGIDPVTMMQSDCKWRLYGRPVSDGSFVARSGWATWTGRLNRYDQPIVFKSEEIISVERFSFDPFPWVN